MEKSLDYKSLVQDIADMQKRELETSVTLNQAKLKMERDSLEAKSLDKINKLRVARGLSPVKKGDKVKKDENFDLFEDESMKVMADFIKLKK
jgi:carboxyl-terminal processing protease